MKFEYETKKDNRECVAYIDADGDLMIKNSSGGTTWWQGNGTLYGEHTHGFNYSEAVHKFYPGDKVTITF